MRAYVAVTALELQEFLQSGEFDVSDAYAATQTFIASNSDLDEEEVEYTLSLVAAEDAIELKSDSTGTACVLALEVPPAIIGAEHDMSISLTAPLQWDYVQCCFEVSADGEELTWFATQEIAPNIAHWLG
jgi:hypothetical protein